MRRRTRNKILMLLVAIIMIAGVVFLTFFVPREQNIEQASIQATEFTDTDGNRCVLEQYPDEGFAVLSIYCDEIQDHTLGQLPAKPGILLNYSKYDIDHYTISFKAENTDDNAALGVFFMPIDDEHTNGSETYCGYVLKATRPNESGIREFEVEVTDIIAEEEIQ